MSLEPGTTLGPYTVTAKIGEGGMGEVYRARDTKLDRDVALKVLPQAFTDDPDRLARFEREAKVLASLNHPNIGHIYGLEEADGQKALVLELVEGPTLAERIKQGPIPVDEALPIAKQIAEALEAAHEQGIIHRDLKPANVKVKEDGTVKVLDFGLAKALRGEPGGDPSESLTAAATATGVLMGTAAYMSPEQAKGKPVGRPTDVWAFGCVLFEMLTGRRAFGGDTVSETLVSVLSKDAPLDDLPTGWPPAGRRLLRRCFERETHKRLRDVTDGLLQTQEELEARSGDSTSLRPAAVVPGRRVLPWVAAVGLAVVTGLAVWFVTRPDSPGLVRFALSGDGANPLVMQSSPDVAISPDGRYVAYLDGVDETGIGAERIRLRRLDQLASETLVEGGGLFSPFFSADSGSVGFTTARTGEALLLQRVSIQGGPTLTICELPNSRSGASWGADGTIVFAMRERLWSVPAEGGEPAQLTTPNQELGEVNHHWPEVLPGSEAVLFTINGDSRDDSQIAVLSRDTGEHKVVLPGGSYPRYSPTQHLVYSADNSLWAVGFDLGRLEVIGEPVLIQEAVPTKTSGASNFDVAENGSLVYIPGEASEALRTMVWVSPEGQPERLLWAQQVWLAPRAPPKTATLLGEWNHDIGVRRTPSCRGTRPAHYRGGVCRRERRQDDRFRRGRTAVSCGWMSSRILPETRSRQHHVDFSLPTWRHQRGASR